MNYRTLGIEEQRIAVHCRVELFLGSFSTMTMWDEKQQRWTNTLKERHALLWSGARSTRVCSRPEPRTDRNNTGGQTRASFECSFIFFPVLSGFVTNAGSFSYWRFSGKLQNHHRANCSQSEGTHLTVTLNQTSEGKRLFKHQNKASYAYSIKN